MIEKKITTVDGHTIIIAEEANGITLRAENTTESIVRPFEQRLGDKTHLIKLDNGDLIEEYN